MVTATINPNGTLSEDIGAVSFPATDSSTGSIVSGVPDWLIYVAGAAAFLFLTKKMGGKKK